MQLLFLKYLQYGKYPVHIPVCLARVSLLQTLLPYRCFLMSISFLVTFTCPLTSHISANSCDPVVCSFFLFAIAMFPTCMCGVDTILASSTVQFSCFLNLLVLLLASSTHSLCRDPSTHHLVVYKY